MRRRPKSPPRLNLVSARTSATGWSLVPTPNENPDVLRPPDRHARRCRRASRASSRRRGLHPGRSRVARGNRAMAGATPMQDDRGAMSAKAKSGYSRYGDIHRRHECAGWEKTMFLLARYTVAAAVFLSASAASAVEDATLSADRMLPACTAFIRDRAPGDVDGVFAAGRCIGLMQGLGFASRLFGVCPPDEVTVAQRARVAVTYVEARPERMHEDFRVLAVEAMQKAWPCK